MVRKYFSAGKISIIIGLLFFAIAMPTRFFHAWAEPQVITNFLHMKFVLVPKGSFIMGGRELPEEVVKKGGGKVVELLREHPTHRVEITRSYYLQTTEVTVEAFKAFVEATSYITGAELDGYSWVWEGKWEKVSGAYWRFPVGPFRSVRLEKLHPVVHVSWYDAVAFCKWLSFMDGKVYRLPTEAEWEYACRAGTETPFFFGDTISTEEANYDGNFTYGAGSKGVYRNKTTPVGSFPPNAWGLHDMHGNVWEWCSDWFDAEYYGYSLLKNPKGPEIGKARVLRGGSWYNYPRILRCAIRFGKSPGFQDGNLGFRVVREY